MIPVKQTIVHDIANGVYGNCFSACLASLLELHIDQVPHFTAHIPKGQREWTDLVNAWLRRRDLAYFEVEASRFDLWVPVLEGIGYYVLTGPSPRGPDWDHAVVARGGRIVHDPHPDDTGLAEGFRLMGFIVRRCERPF